MAGHDGGMMIALGWFAFGSRGFLWEMEGWAFRWAMRFEM